SKAACFREMRERLYGGTLELFEHRQLLGELRRIGTKYTARGLTIQTPRVGDSHCDLAIALALACWAAREEGGPPAAVETTLPWGYSGFAQAHPVRSEYAA